MLGDDTRPGAQARRISTTRPSSASGGVAARTASGWWPSSWITAATSGGDGQRMLYTAIHPSCYPMDLPRMVAASDIEGIDFFEVQFGLTEIGDN